MFLVVKVIVISLAVVAVSLLAGKRPVVAGFVAVLPFTSALSLVFIYLDGHDMQKMNHFAVAAVSAIPLSMCFFIPFLAHRWTKLSFIPSFFLGLAILVVAYAAAYLVHKKIMGG